MLSISEKMYAEQSSIKSVENFYDQFQLGSALKHANIYKGKGIPAVAIIKYLISLIYTGKSMFQDMRSQRPLANGLGKDPIYRLLNLTTVNWQSFLLRVACKVVGSLNKLTGDDRLSAFVIDDTFYQMPYAKKTELVSLVHDHAEKGKNKFKWGFRMLTLIWTDGVSVVPLAFRHLASSDEKKQRCGCKDDLDKRTCGYRARKEAVLKATDVLILQLKAALKAGIFAKYVLFDSWFAYPVTIAKVCSLGLHVVARVKDSTKIKYLVNDVKKTAKQIYKENRKRRGKSRYLLSVEITLYCEENGKTVLIPARLVYVRNRNKRKDWIAIICTDTTLSEEEIISLYGKRWDIEVFFKICKSYLKLTGEFHQLSYDALTAHTTIVMIRYMILSVEKRRQEDPRSLSDLFFSFYDEVDDIKFEQAIMFIMSTLMDVLKEEDLELSIEQVDKIINRIIQRFMEKLPPSMFMCLQPNFEKAS